MNNWYVIPKDDDIMHFGILGMKWGVRRYQNKDGTLTSLGEKRYGRASNILSKSKKVYKSTKELDAAAKSINDKIGTKENIGDGITINYTEHGNRYEKKIKTDVGNIELQSIDNNINLNDLKRHFKNAEKNSSEMVKKAANIIMKDTDLVSILASKDGMDASQSEIASFKKKLSNGKIWLEVSNGSNSNTSVDICFTPSNLDGYLSINATIDRNGKINHIDDYVDFGS